MKKILRYYLINVLSLWVTAQIIPGLQFSGGARTFLVGGAAFAIINFLLIPLLRILFLPLNLLTLGIFSWLINVLALYALTAVVSGINLVPYTFEGFLAGGFSIPDVDLTTFWVAVVASFAIGVITHFLQWIAH